MCTPCYLVTVYNLDMSSLFLKGSVMSSVVDTLLGGILGGASRGGFVMYHKVTLNVLCLSYTF